MHLRIEDTDKARSTEEATQAIIDGLAWLGVEHDGDIIYQSQNQAAHIAAAEALLSSGAAFRCYLTPEELESEREKARDNGTAFRSSYRDGKKGDGPFVVRFRVPDGKTVIEDAVQGTIEWHNSNFDDLVLLRADGTPTYMLSVVVDDHDMGVTHVIRGDDHLTNAFRQTQLYQAMGWDVPVFAHVPLIHGADGAKLSKRHGAVGTEAYQAMGILPEAMFNYLLRLGWSHGDEEIIAREDAIKWFDLDHVGKSPSRLDIDKLYHVNAHYIKESNNKDLLGALNPFFEEKLGAIPSQPTLDLYLRLMDELKDRAKTLPEIVETGLFLTQDTPDPVDEKAQAALSSDSKGLLEKVQTTFSDLADWSGDAIFGAIKALAEEEGMKMGQAAQRVRAAVTGYTSGPSLGKVLEIFGKDDVLRRLDYTLQHLS